MELDFLVTSKTKRKVLSSLFNHPNSEFYLREICRNVNEETNAVKRELDKFENAGLVSSSKRGKMLFYSLNKGFFLYEELRSMFVKTDGVLNVVKAALKKIPNVERAFLYGSIVTGNLRHDSDIDLLLVGKINPSKLSKVTTELEKKLGRPIMPTVYSPKEFEKKKNSAFLRGVLEGEKLAVVGEAD